MPVMNFDLEDGEPPVSFNLKPEDCDRMMQFMHECSAMKNNGERYVYLRDEHIGNDPESINLPHGDSPGLDSAVDKARGK